MLAVLCASVLASAGATSAGAPAFEMRDGKARIAAAREKEAQPFELRGSFRIESPAVEASRPFALISKATKGAVGCGDVPPPVEGRIFRDGFE